MDKLDKLKEQYEKLGKEIKALETKPKAWVYQDRAYTCIHRGEINPVGRFMDLETYYHNLYPDCEITRKMIAWRELEDKMRIAANDYNFKVGKYNTYILYNKSMETVVTSFEKVCSIPGVIYFETTTAAREFIDSLSEDEVQVLKNGRPVY